VSAADNEQSKAEKKVEPRMEEPEPADDVMNEDTVAQVVAAQESVKKEV
jgi:hypothetical protein